MMLTTIAEALRGKKCNTGYMCQCPAHDDDHASLSVSDGDKGIVFHCHAGCTQTAVLAALKDRGLWKANGAAERDKTIAATYDYLDADSKLIFQVVRYLPKDFRQRKPDGAGGWTWSVRGITPVPYRLPAVLKSIAAGEPVYIVEGEKDVESLGKIGITASCNSGGASKWRSEHARYFRDAKVIVIPDNDEPGREHANKVAQSLSGIAVSVTTIELPGLPPKGDVSDWLANGGSREELEKLAADAPTPEYAPLTVEGCTDADEREDKKTTAQVLIEIALKNCDLFHDERNDGYAVLVHGGIRRTLKLRAREFRRWLAGTFYATTARAANNEALSTAMQVLEAKATFDGRQLQLSNRFAFRDGAIYIDLSDPEWRVIRVTVDGWETMLKPPVLFRRYSHQQALPVPIRGGKLSDVHSHLAIRTPDDKLLLEAWLVASAFEHLPRPAVDFHGPQGASKSTSARILKSITDPSVTESVDIGKPRTLWAAQPVLA